MNTTELQQITDAQYKDLLKKKGIPSAPLAIEGGGPGEPLALEDGAEDVPGLSDFPPNMPPLQLVPVR